MMRDAADMAAQSDPERNRQFSRPWSDRRPTKPSRRAVADALAAFAPHRGAAVAKRLATLKHGQHRTIGHSTQTEAAALLNVGADQRAESHAAGQYPQICGASQTEATKSQNNDMSNTVGTP